MVARSDFVACARTWLGTPTRHQGRAKGVGADCKGVVCGTAAELGLPEALSLAARVHDYSKGFRGRDLLAGLQANLIKTETPLPGDLLAIMFGRDPDPRHLAIVTEPGWMIHAYFGAKVVAEVPQSHWRVHSIWTWPSFSESPDG